MLQRESHNQMLYTEYDEPDRTFLQLLRKNLVVLRKYVHKIHQAVLISAVESNGLNRGLGKKHAEGLATKKKMLQRESHNQMLYTEYDEPDRTFLQLLRTASAMETIQKIHRQDIYCVR
jgi:hypothetical protein